MENYSDSAQMDYLLTDQDETYLEKDDVTIVVPVLNEALAIELVLRDIMREGYPHILVIDGHSIDDSVSIVKKMNVDVYPQVGKGKTGAIKTALNYVRTPYLVLIDGDSTYSAKDIDLLMKKAPFYNQVIGARRDQQSIPVLNRFGNRAINLFFNYSFSAGLTDVCSGLYVLNSDFAKKMVLDTTGFDVEVEIAAQSAKTNKVIETGISYKDRIGPRKLRPIRDGYFIMSSIMNLSKRYNPLLFWSYFIGFLLIAASIGLTMYNYLMPLNVLFLNSYLLQSILVIIGFQFIILSLIIYQLNKLDKKRVSNVQFVG